MKWYKNKSLVIGVVMPSDAVNLLMLASFPQLNQLEIPLIVPDLLIIKVVEDQGQIQLLPHYFFSSYDS